MLTFSRTSEDGAAACRPAPSAGARAPVAGRDESQTRILALFASVTKFGAERSNIEVLCRLRDRGAAVLLLAPDAPWAREIRDFITAHGLDYEVYPNLLRPQGSVRSSAAALSAVGRASAKLLAVIRTFKPTHLHAFSQFAVLNFLPALALTRTPLVYRCGDKPIRHNLAWRLTWRFLIARARRFVAISRFIEREVVAAGVSADRMSLIYNAPPTRLPGSDGSADEDLGGGRTIAFAGQLIENKGPHLLIEAFRRLADAYPDARLLLAGPITDWPGDDWARDLRARTMADGALAGRVRFLGFVEDVPALMAKCLVSVAPTISEEPLGNVVMEAKQGGIPTIVFPSGGLPEMIEHGVDGYVCPERSVEALEAALRAYLDDPERSAHEGRAAKASLEDRFAVSSYAARWAAVFDAARAGTVRH